MAEIAPGAFLPQPGQIVLFGSGETSPTGRKIFDGVLRRLPQPPSLALLETPAGFELNSHQVIGRVGEFFTRQLQNYSPQVEIIPARKRGTEFSPDNPAILSPLLKADLIFMGPGSPSYAIRQLRGSLAWHYLVARHRMGASLALASAATVAISSLAVPVYEIYKVGEDLHWIEGLDFFKYYGLQLVFIPHWNNNEGGADLDTSRCFMGRERFMRLMELLPGEITIIGLDEKTALIIDPASCMCQVMGAGRVTLLHTGHQHPSTNLAGPLADNPSLNPGTDEDLAAIANLHGGHSHQYISGHRFHITEIGPFHAFHPEASLPSAIWLEAIQAQYQLERDNLSDPPEEVSSLMQARQAARQAHNWNLADNLRQQINQLGWEIQDTKTGPVCRKIS